MTPREQGDIGELSAMSWLVEHGAHLYLPVGHSPDIDIVAHLGGRLIRVEVKTATRQPQPGRWTVSIATRGGNQSWSGLVKYFDPDRCDFLFAHVGDGRRWLIPTGGLDATTSITVGGPKYSEFEVESGQPLLPEYRNKASNPRESTVSTIPTRFRGSAEAGESGRPVKPVAMPEWVRFPPPPSASTELSPTALGRYRTRASANHQVTIPGGCFEEARLSCGDRFAVQACGDGKVLLTRIEENPTDLALFASDETISADAD